VELEAEGRRKVVRTVHLCRTRGLFTDRATPKNLKRDGGEIKGKGIAATNGGRYPPRLNTVERMGRSCQRIQLGSLGQPFERPGLLLDTEASHFFDWSADNCFHRLT
jgi:hypothetical protein